MRRESTFWWRNLAYLRLADYRAAIDARNKAGRVVCVGENDHYKPLAVCLRRLVKEGALGDMVFAQFTSIVRRLKRPTTGAMTRRWPGGRVL